MPFVRIDLAQGKPVQFRKALGEIVYRAMREVINVPEGDKFQVISEHPSEALNVAESYLGNHYSKDVILIQITLNAGRTTEMKKAFFKRIADDFHTQLQFALVAGKRGGRFERGARLLAAAELLQQIAAHAGQQVIGFQGGFPREP